MNPILVTLMLNQYVDKSRLARGHFNLHQQIRLTLAQVITEETAFYNTRLLIRQQFHDFVGQLISHK